MSKIRRPIVNTPAPKVPKPTVNPAPIQPKSPKIPLNVPFKPKPVKIPLNVPFKPAPVKVPNPGTLNVPFKPVKVPNPATLNVPFKGKKGD